MDINRAKIALADAYDPDELVGVLGIEAWEILERFEDKVYDYVEKDGFTGDSDENLE